MRTVLTDFLRARAQRLHRHNSCNAPTQLLALLGLYTQSISIGASMPLTGAFFVTKYGNFSSIKALSACRCCFSWSKIASTSARPTGPRVRRHSTKRLICVPRISCGKSTANVTSATLCCVPRALSRSSIGQRRPFIPTCFKGILRKSFSLCTSFTSFTSVHAATGASFPNFYFI